MKTKTLFSILLLGFVAVSVVLAFRKIGPQPSPDAQQAISTNDAGVIATPIGLDAKLAESQFSVVYFHAPNRCQTCRKIEKFAHEALAPEIEASKLAWQTADFTASDNASLVDQFKVYTSTVVLVEVQDGDVVRWKKLDGVWDHTKQQADFTAYVNQAWSEFKAS